MKNHLAHIIQALSKRPTVHKVANSIIHIKQSQDLHFSYSKAEIIQLPRKG